MQLNMTRVGDVADDGVPTDAERSAMTAVPHTVAWPLITTRPETQASPSRTA